MKKLNQPGHSYLAQLAAAEVVVQQMNIQKRGLVRLCSSPVKWLFVKFFSNTAYILPCFNFLDESTDKPHLFGETTSIHFPQHCFKVPKAKQGLHVACRTPVGLVWSQTYISQQTNSLQHLGNTGKLEQLPLS